MQRIFFVVLLFFSYAASAQKFKFNLAYLSNVNIGTYNFIEQESDFSTRNRHTNSGLSISVSCFPFKKIPQIFVESGARLLSTQAFIAAVNDVPGHGSGIYPTLYWENKWRTITIPLHFGYTIRPIWWRGGYIDVLAGMSFGSIKYSMFGSGSMLTKSKADTELIGAGLGGPRSEYNGFSSCNLTTLDAGFRFAPLPKYPKWSIGFMVVYNLKNTTSVARDGFISNETQGIFKPYYYKMNMHFTNYVFSLNYSFGKKWKREMLPN